MITQRFLAQARCAVFAAALVAALFIAKPGAAVELQSVPIALVVPSSSSESVARNALKRACQTTAIQYRVKCAGKGVLRDICRSNWGTGARFGDIGYDRRGLLVCVQVPSGFIGVWQRF